MTDNAWDQEDIAAIAATHGVTWLSADQLKRLMERANDVAATARSMRRVASKFDEPAHVFRGPPIQK